MAELQDDAWCLHALTELAGTVASYEYDAEMQVEVNAGLHDVILSHLKAGDEQAASAALETACDATSHQPVIIQIEIKCVHAHAGPMQTNPKAGLSLHLAIPPGYPSTPVHCTISSSSPPFSDGQWQSSTEQQLLETACNSAEQGLPCLFQLMEQVRECVVECQSSVNDNSDRHSPRNRTSGGVVQDSQSADKSSSAAIQQLVVKLDHVHNRGMYCKILKSWMNDLAITGRLLFYNGSGPDAKGQGPGASGVILLLLEGSEDSLKEYLVRHRTETVDVDSRGRKCRERMMKIMLQQPTPKSAQSFDDYREISVGSMKEVKEILGCMDLTGHMKAILGISSG